MGKGNPNGNQPSITAAKRRAFFAGLVQRGTVTFACSVSGISYASAYRLRDTDPVFAERWREAIQQHKDILLGEATRRAVEGVTTVTRQYDPKTGVLVREIEKTEYSDQLMVRLLEGRLPDMFRRNVDLNVKPNATQNDAAQLTREDLLRIAAASALMGDGRDISAEVEAQHAEEQAIPPGAGDVLYDDTPLFDDDDPDLDNPNIIIQG
jgi:hypothetical protein